MEEDTAIKDQGEEAGPKGRTRGTFAALAYADFRLLWIAQMAYAAALWVEMIARPLLVLEITNGSAIHLGLMIATRTVPLVGMGLIAGVLADIFNRKTVLLVSYAFGSVTCVIFAVLVIMGWIELWHVYVFAFLRGTGMALDQPARQAIIPSILPRHLVTNAMALNTGSAQVMRLGGAAGAGILVATIGMGWTFMAVAVLNILTLCFSIFIRIPDIDRKGYQGASNMLTDFKEGFRYAWDSPTVRGVLVIAMVYFTFGSSFMQVFAPYFSKEVMGIGESGFGYMMAVSGLGGVTGALILAKTSPSKGRGRLLLSTTAIFGVFLVLFALTTYTNWVVLAFGISAFLGLGQAFTFPLMNSVLVDSAPVRMRGRIMSLVSLDRAMISLGGAMAGFTIALIGGQPAQIIFGIACTLVSIAMFAFSPAIRRIA